MEVTAWNNGQHRSSGAGYGIKIGLVDRDRYFLKCRKFVYVILPGGAKVKVNTDKASFWDNSCRELINKEIGKWFIDNNKAPWPSGSPPRYQLDLISERHFSLTCKDSKS